MTDAPGTPSGRGIQAVLPTLGMRRPVERLELFSTPVCIVRMGDDERLGELNRALTQHFVAESLTHSGVDRSNAGGWHSTPDLAQRADPLFRAATDLVVGRVRACLAELMRPADETPRYGLSVHGWAMVMRDGDHIVLHDHAESHWAVAYYSDAGNAHLAGFPDSGLLAIVDPRRGSARTPQSDVSATTFTVRPESGMLVLFPGFLQHYVHPYRGSRPRVSLSFNLVVHPEPAVHPAGRPDGTSAG